MTSGFPKLALETETLKHLNKKRERKITLKCRWQELFKGKIDCISREKDLGWSSVAEKNIIFQIYLLKNIQKYYIYFFSDSICFLDFKDIFDQLFPFVNL